MLDSVELKSRKEYWLHVHACLVQIHKFPEAKASEIVDDYKRRFPLKSEKPSIELIYHTEAFQLACDMAGVRLTVRDFSDEYGKILEIGTSQPGARKEKQSRHDSGFKTIDSDLIVKEEASLQRKSTSRSVAKKSTGKSVESSSQESGSRKAIAGKRIASRAAGSNSGAKKITASASRAKRK